MGAFEKSRLNAIFSRIKNLPDTISQGNQQVLELLQSPTHGLAALFTKMNGGGVSVVKSVQRGTHTGNINGANITITVASVNPAKSHVTIYGHYSGNSYSTSYDPFSCNNPYVKAFTATALTLSQSSWLNGGSRSENPFSWEIVEYY